MKLGIRTKLFVLLLGVIVVSVLLLAGYVSSQLRGTIEDRIARDLTVRAALVARDVERARGGADWPTVAAELGTRAQARVSLLGRDGAIIADSAFLRPADADGAPDDRRADRTEVREALQRGQGSARRPGWSDDGVLYVAVAIPSNGPVGVVRVAQSLQTVDDAVAQARRTLLMGTLVAVLAAALLAAFGSQVISKSLRDLRRSATAMVDDLSVRTRLHGADEVEASGEAIDRLADKLSSSLQLVESERDRLEGIIETMAEGVLLVDPDGQIVLANASLRTMVGSTVQIGKQPIEAIRSDELAEMIAAVGRTGHMVSGEIDLLGPVSRRVRVRAQPLAGRGTHGVVAVLSDVTDLRRLESMRKDFVANVSHELRTPIAAIRAAAETLEGGAIDDPTAAKDFLAMINRQSERLQQLVEDLLELSRIEAQKLNLVPEKISASSLIDHLISLYALSASKRGLHLAAGVPSPDVAVFADRRAIEQVLSNLIDNAIKYCPFGGSVTVSAHDREGEIQLSVSDSGPGISAQHLPRLFERFYRVDRGRSRDVGGTGLGLSIVKHLCEAQGGRVTVESTPGRGSTFTVHLPCCGNLLGIQPPEGGQDEMKIPSSPVDETM